MCDVVCQMSAVVPTLPSCANTFFMCQHFLRATTIEVIRRLNAVPTFLSGARSSKYITLFLASTTEFSMLYVHLTAIDENCATVTTLARRIV